jgi:hypothetical protein
MAKWNAYYFDNLEASSGPRRVEAIEAESEDEAAKIAIAEMGRSMRVHVTRTLWEMQSELRLADQNGSARTWT